MRYHHVCLEAFGYCLPDEIVTSDEIERRLEPLYRRLKLPEGRLELMTGIRERRFWAPGTLPSDKSIESASLALEAAGLDRHYVGALVHGSVCRDRLEPATACRVHHGLGLSPHCQIYDVSNACLGLLNGIVQVANLIELGHIRAGIVVGTESSRQLVENTIESLNRTESLTRSQLKPALASLTIGSASCAILLTDRELSRTGNRLGTVSARAYTQHHQLCQSDCDQAGPGMRPLMDTDSETLMREGIQAGVATFADFLSETGWSAAELDHAFCHQVGGTHRRLMLEALGIPVDKDFTTFEWLGNTGAVALPVTMALGVQQRQAAHGQRIGMFGIGSGINCLMMSARWNQTLVRGRGAISAHCPAHSPAERPVFIG